MKKAICIVLAFLAVLLCFAACSAETQQGEPGTGSSTVPGPDGPESSPAGSTAGNWRLAPGASYDPHGTVWALCIGGTGGRAGWEKQIKELED